MSLASWKSVFYPHDLGTFEGAQVLKGRSPADVTLMSLVKWVGLTPPMLEAHGLAARKGTGIIFDPKKMSYEEATAYYKITGPEDDRFMDITARDCSLCAVFRTGTLYCYQCPFYRAEGQRCYGRERPYAVWVSDASARPMVKALRRVFFWCRRQDDKNPRDARDPVYEIVGLTQESMLIKDVGDWTAVRTVTNGAEAVARELQMLPQDGRALDYVDSDGDISRLQCDQGIFSGFAVTPDALKETYRTWFES